MKIGFVMDTTLDSNDGVQQYVKTLGRYFASHGHEIYYLVGESEHEPQFGEKIFSLSKNLYVRGNSNVVSVPVLIDYVKLWEVLNTEKIDILHVQVPFSPILSGVILNETDIPRVGTIHIFPANPALTIGSRLYSLTQQKSLNSFHKFVAVSKAAQEYARNGLGIESEIIPNMIDTSVYRDAKPIDKFDDGKLNILFLGRLVKRKGANYLLKAYARIKHKNQNIRLIIGGEGDLKESLKRYVKNHKIDDVEFVGFIKEEDKARYFARADVCVFPSTGGESFGIVLIEAMAAGKPIIAFDNDGYRAVLEEDLPEALCENKSITELSEMLFELVYSKEQRVYLGKKAKSISHKYDVAVVGKRILEIYESVIKNSKME